VSRTEYLDSDPYHRPRQMPETFVERIAWALCAADQTSDGSYLNDDELRGLTVLLGKMAAMCGNERAEAEWLGVPMSVVVNSIRRLKLLARMERQRRDNPDPMFGAHLTAAFWPDYMVKAEAAWSAMLQDASVSAAIKEPPHAD
jgi:hypothetical protein